MNSSVASPVLQIRKFSMEDLDRITAMLREVGYPTTLSVMKERMEAMEQDPLHSVFVAEMNNQVVGMVDFRQVTSYCKQHECIAEITALIVDERLRGQGLGRRLVFSAEEWARVQGCSQIFLKSGNRVERAPAHAFYRRIGFEKSGYRFVKSLV